MPGTPLDALAARLRRELTGEVLFDAWSRGRYSTDASIYQIEPLGVVVPRTADEAVRAAELAVAAGVPILPRGAGTSQCGQTVGAALVIDTSKHLNRLLEVDARERTAWVEPGIVLDDLNARLKQHGLWYPVDVSTSAQATIGGMTANNSCGARSLRYGNMVHNVLEVETWLTSGETLTFGAVDAGPPPGAPRHRELVATVRELYARERDEIEARVPKLQRRVAGYNLDLASSGRVQRRAAARRLRRNARAVPQDQAQARAAARAQGARRRALPDFLSGDGPHSAHRRARAHGRRARRPHDDRAVARHRGLPRDDGQDDPRRARRDPARRVRGRRARAASSRSSPRLSELMGDLGSARQRRRDRRRGLAARRVGGPQSGPQHHDVDEGRRQTRVVHRGLRRAARASRRLHGPLDAACSRSTARAARSTPTRRSAACTCAPC